MQNGEIGQVMTAVLQKVRRELRQRQGWAGFTLIELMIVITILLILMSIAIGRYQQSVLRAKEAALKQDLMVMRKAIDEYTLDKEAAPQSLEDLVSAKYLSIIPTDPMTNQKDWRVVYEDVLLSPDQASSGITNVFSNSDQISPFENTPYNTW
jgi:general secretion pathway protein G